MTDQIYTHLRRGGRYELIGVSTGQGGSNMETRTVYRDLDTGKVHHRRTSDFERFMAVFGSVTPRAEILARALELRAEARMSWARIAELLGVKPTWLKTNLDSAGLVQRAVRRELLITPEKTRAAIALREQKVQWKAIARQLDVNVNSIRRAIYDGRHLVD